MTTPVLGNPGESGLESLPFVDADRPLTVRSPVTVVRLGVALAFLGLATAVASISGGDTSGFAGNVTPLILSVPRWLLTAVLGSLQVGIALCAVIGVMSQIITGRARRLLWMLVAAVLGGLLLALIGRLLGTGVITIGRPKDSPLGIGTTFPSLVNLSILAAGISVDNAWWGRRWRRYGRLLVGATVVARLLVASTDPGALAVAVCAGWTCGRLVLVAVGTPNPRPPRAELAAALARFGYLVDQIAEAPRRRGQQFHSFVTHDSEQRTLFVKVFGRESWTTLLPVRIYRSLRYRDSDDPPFESIRHRVEHEALCALKAHSDGVPSARMAVVTPFGIDSMMLAFEAGHFELLNALPDDRWTPELLSEIWMSVAQLRQSRIVHHRLSAERMIIDALGQVRVIDFSDAEIGASDRSLSIDVAEVLAVTAARVGPIEAVAAAQSVLGSEVVASTLPRLQPLALTPSTRSAIRKRGGMRELIAEVQSATGATEAPLEELQRIKPTTLLIVGTTALAGWLLIPQLLRMGNVWDDLRDANWWWALGALGFALVSYIGAAAAFDGSVPDRVPFLPNLAVQFASGLASVVSSGVGLALGARFLQRRGVDPAIAVGAMGVNTVAGAAVHVSLVGVFIAFGGTRVFDRFTLSLPTTALVAVGAVVVVAIAVAAASSALRRIARERVLPVLRRAAHGVVDIAHRPTKIAELLGGSATITLANVFALVASVEAFGGGPSAVEIALVYLVGSAISNAAPTPGAIGVTEAALTAGLTSAGMSADVALAAVLLFRLVTFWLPLVPGWIAFAGLQRAGDI